MAPPADRFPVLANDRLRGRYPDCPRSVPLAAVLRHRGTVEANHYQTVERLRSGGGVPPDELWLALHDMGLWFRTPPMAEMVAFLQALDPAPPHEPS